MPQWGYSKKKGRAYIKRPRLTGIRASDFEESEGITKHHFKNPNDFEINEDELEVFASDKAFDSTIDCLIFDPVSEQTWKTIGYEGLDEEQGIFDKDKWVEAILPLSSEDKQGLMNFNAETVEKFNEFDIRLKERYNMKLTDLIDYDNGIVKIVKVE